MARVRKADVGGGDAAGIEVRSPASGALLAHVPSLDRAAVAALAKRGRAAQPAWADLAFDGRGAVLARMQRWLIDNSERVVETVMSETGKTVEDAQLLELSYTISAVSFWRGHAERYLKDHRAMARTPLIAGRRLVRRYVPYGLVGVIGPWNYPLLNSFGDCIPALAAGNSVLLKPSELTPLTSLLIAEGLAECGLPDGVFQVATGAGETGAALVDAVDFVMFTGSIETGRAVARQAAGALTPFALELGGKDAMIVLAGADLERAANAAVYYGMINAGQACISIERVYAEAAIYDELTGLLGAKLAQLRCGAPAGPGSVDVGAITDPRQLVTIEKHVADAVAKGARVVVGGKQAGGSGPSAGSGTFYEPTLLVDVDHTMLCMTDETFGPTLPVMAVADADAAVRLVNASRYGLGAAVFAADNEIGEAVARRLEVGAVCVNDAGVFYFALEAPMGGFKESGIGVRHGPDGIRKFCRPQTIVLTPRLAPNREPQMFPYSARVTARLGRAVKLLYARRRSS
jgi:acyl-CoA reductase-like NAD-dependent aldehyde dehydrogenase